MLRSSVLHSRLLILLLVVGVGAMPLPARTNQHGPLEDAGKALESVNADNARGAYPAAATRTLELVRTLRADARGAANSGDRDSYIAAACTALDFMIAARPCERVIAERELMRMEELCPTPANEPAPEPVACEEPTVVSDPPAQPAVGPTPGPAGKGPIEPARPDPVVDAPEAPKHLRHTAIATGALGGVALLSSVVMAAVAARSDPTDCSPLAGSYCKVYAEAKAADAPHGAADDLCSAAARGLNDRLDHACSQRQGLVLGTYVTLALGAALGLTAVATGVLDHLDRKRHSGAKRAAVSLQPIVGRSLMMQATVRF